MGAKLLDGFGTGVLGTPVDARWTGKVECCSQGAATNPLAVLAAMQDAMPKLLNKRSRFHHVNQIILGILMLLHLALKLASY